MAWARNRGACGPVPGNERRTPGVPCTGSPGCARGGADGAGASSSRPATPRKVPWRSSTPSSGAEPNSPSTAVLMRTAVSESRPRSVSGTSGSSRSGAKPMTRARSIRSRSSRVAAAGRDSGAGSGSTTSPAQYRRCCQRGGGTSVIRPSGCSVSRAEGTRAPCTRSVARAVRKDVASSVPRRSVGTTSASSAPAASRVRASGWAWVGCGATSTNTRCPSRAAARTACSKRTGRRRLASQ